MNTVPLAHFLALASALFAIGLAAVLIRRNALLVFMGVELMLNAANVTFLAFSRNRGLMAAGAVLLVAPHVIGAPEPPSHDVSYPGALAGEFVVASLAVSALLWSLSGLAAGWLHHRLSQSG